MKRTEYNKKRRELLLLKGKCGSHCNNNIVIGYKCCQKCIDNNKLRMVKSKLVKKCRNHPNDNIVPGHTICEKCIQQSKNKYIKNKGKILEQQSQFRENNQILMKYRKIKQRAKENNIPFNITEQDIIDIIPKDSKCPVFKTTFEYKNKDTGMSLDRIIPENGYIKGNIQIISNLANRVKQDATREELLKLADWFIKNNKIEKVK